MFFSKYTHVLIVYFDMLYTYVNLTLIPIFSNTDLGIFIRKVVSLVLIPVGIAAIPALVYRLIKGKQLPYFFEITWVLWLVIALSKILIH